MQGESEKDFNPNKVVVIDKTRPQIPESAAEILRSVRRCSTYKQVEQAMQIIDPYWAADGSNPRRWAHRNRIPAKWWGWLGANSAFSVEEIYYFHERAGHFD